MAEQRFARASTPLLGLWVLERKRIGDDRGFLSRLFCADEFAAFGFGPVMQINHTLTERTGTIRGMHYQDVPHAEDKFVSCLRGAIFDVAVDVREESPTFLQWYGTELSEKNQRSLLIPKGFAHGFQTLVDGCELLYLHSASYAPSAERALNALDPAIAVAWPLATSAMSDRDKGHELVGPNFTGVCFEK